MSLSPINEKGCLNTHSHAIDERDFFSIEEVADIIFNFLPLNSYPRISLVCKQWKRLAQDEVRWKRICSKLGWITEGSWLELAQNRFPHYRTFHCAEALRRIPSTSCVQRVNMNARQRSSPSNYCLRGFMINNTTEIIVDHNQKIWAFPHVESISNAQIFEDKLVTLDGYGFLRVFNLAKKNCIATYEELSCETLFTLKNHVLITVCSYKIKDACDKWSKCTVRYVDRSNEDYLFNLHCDIESIALEGNVLVLRESGLFPKGNDTLHLVDINKKIYTHFTDPYDSNLGSKMVWEGETLLTYKWRFDEQKATLERLDFSSMSSRHNPTPLTYLETEL